MTLVNFKHGLFLTCTHKSHYIYRSFIAIFTRCTAFPPDPTPLHFNKTTLLYLLGEPASLLVVTNTHLPLSLVRQQSPHPLLCPSHPVTPHSSNYIIYIDDINNSRSSSSGTIKVYGVIFFALSKPHNGENLGVKKVLVPSKIPRNAPWCGCPQKNNHLLFKNRRYINSYYYMQLAAVWSLLYVCSTIYTHQNMHSKALDHPEYWICCCVRFPVVAGIAWGVTGLWRMSHFPHPPVESGEIRQCWHDELPHYLSSYEIQSYPHYFGKQAEAIGERLVWTLAALQ